MSVAWVPHHFLFPSNPNHQPTLTLLFPLHLHLHVPPPVYFLSIFYNFQLHHYLLSIYPFYILCSVSLYFWSFVILLRILFEQMFPICSFEWEHCDFCRLSTWCVCVFIYLLFFNIWVNGSGKLDLECYP